MKNTFKTGIELCTCETKGFYCLPTSKRSGFKFNCNAKRKTPRTFVQRVVTCMDVLMSRRHGCLRATYGSLTFLKPKRKKSRDLSDTGFFEWESDGELLSHGNSTLPSPQLRFTSEFEMESGGATALLPSDKNRFVFKKLESDILK